MRRLRKRIRMRCKPWIISEDGDAGEERLDSLYGYLRLMDGESRAGSEGASVRIVFSVKRERLSKTRDGCIRGDLAVCRSYERREESGVWPAVVGVCFEDANETWGVLVEWVLVVVVVAVSPAEVAVGVSLLWVVVVERRGVSIDLLDMLRDRVRWRRGGGWSRGWGRGRG